jgi:transcriptional regulator
MEEDALLALLERLSAKYEEGRPNAWRLSEAPPDFIAKMVRTIVGFTVDVERIDGKFKLSQNRPADDVPRIVAALEREGERDVAELMREHLGTLAGGKIHT